jgi:hypothetical protein
VNLHKPSTDPGSVEARLEGYETGRVLSPPPTLCRWRHDWKATKPDVSQALHRPTDGLFSIKRVPAVDQCRHNSAPQRPTLERRVPAL